MELNEKQIQIIEAAEHLFAQKGFAGASVRDIAESAGVNLAMISYYFGSKDGLIEAMFRRRTASYRLQLESLLQNDSLTSLEKVDRLISQYIDRIFSNQCFHRIMIREQMGGRDNPISAMIYQLKQSNLELVEQLVRQGQERGEFKPGVEADLLMLTLTGTASQLTTTQHFYRTRHQLEHLSTEEFETYLKAKLNNHIQKIFKAILTNEA